MSRAATDSKIAFVAYPGADAALVAVLSEALALANSRSNRVRYQPWQFNDIAGRPLASPIVDAIGQSIFIVADISHLNLNVVYEIGLAIGGNRRVLLVRNADIPDDKQLAQEVGIFDTLGYREYSGGDDLAHYLSNILDDSPLPIAAELNRLAPVYVVEPPIRSDAATAMTSRLKKNARYRYRSFNPTEDIRLSAADAIRQVAASAGVLLILQDHHEHDGLVHDLRTMFVAGLADGMSKPLLILGPADYSPPLDIRDDVKRYRESEDIGRHIHELALQITEYLQEAAPVALDKGTLLQSLRIGDPTAENEMATLGEYYLPLDQYERTLRGEVNLVVGRKGSGKTALFIQVRDQIRRHKPNVVVDLKPEGYQLIKLKEEIFDYLSEGARQHLITAFWEYLLLLEVAYKLLDKDRNIYKHNHDIIDVYRRLEAAYSAEGLASGADFSERLLGLSRRLSAAFRERFGTQTEQRLVAEEVSELLYGSDIRELRRHISNYLTHKRAVWVLFDNLDKGWNVQGVDETDTVILRCLIDASRRLEREMQRDGHEFHCVVFVRNDVYENLMRTSADYGKEMRAVMDWTDADMLREMLRLRLVSGLEDSLRTTSFEDLWPRICVSHYGGEETSGYMIARSLMRPRNLLKIFGHSLGFANNFNRTLITEEDFTKGLLAYSHDLLIELDRELADVIPSARDVLYHFLDVASILTREDVHQRFADAGIAERERETLLDFLLYYGVLGLHSAEEDLYIFDVNYDQRILRIRVQRAGADAVFAVNPAFWPALDVRPA